MKARTARKPGIGLKPTSRRSWPVEHWSSAGSMTLAPSRGVAASMCRTCCLLWSPSVPGWSYVLGFQFRSFPNKVGRLRQLCSRNCVVAGQPPTPSDQFGRGQRVANRLSADPLPQPPGGQLACGGPEQDFGFRCTAGADPGCTGRVGMTQESFAMIGGYDQSFQPTGYTRTSTSSSV